MTCELYLENVAIPMGASNKEIAMSITAHGLKNGVRIMNCQVKRNKYVSDQVGCKITVPSTQSSLCKNHDIWPTHVACRDWIPRSELPDTGKRNHSWGHRNERRDRYDDFWDDLQVDHRHGDHHEEYDDWNEGARDW